MEEALEVAVAPMVVAMDLVVVVAAEEEEVAAEATEPEGFESATEKGYSS